MKKYLFLFSLMLASLIASAQAPIDHTRESRLLMNRATQEKEALIIPMGPEPFFPSYLPEDRKQGALFMDTLGTNKGLKRWNGSVWVDVGGDQSDYARKSVEQTFLQNNNSLGWWAGRNHISSSFGLLSGETLPAGTSIFGDLWLASSGAGRKGVTTKENGVKKWFYGQDAIGNYVIQRWDGTQWLNVFSSQFANGSTNFLSGVSVGYPTSIDPFTPNGGSFNPASVSLNINGFGRNGIRFIGSSGAEIGTLNDQNSGADNPGIRWNMPMSFIYDFAASLAGDYVLTQSPTSGVSNPGRIGRLLLSSFAMASDVTTAINNARTQPFYVSANSGSTVTASALQNVTIISITRSGATYYTTASTNPTGNFCYYNPTAGSILFQDAFNSLGEPLQISYTATTATANGQSVPIITYGSMAAIVYPTSNTFIVVNANEDQDGARWIFYAPAGTTNKSQLQVIASTTNTF